MEVKALVFDLDGTLIDSVPAVAAAINRVLIEEGRDRLPVEAVKGMVGHGAIQTLEKALDATGGRDGYDLEALVERYLAAYLDDPAGATVIYPGVTEVLEGYVEAGVPMGICTNKPGATTRPVLEALNMSRFFSAVLTADDTPNRKPDGRHILETLEAMGVGPQGAAMIGDSETDMASAVNAGVPGVAVTWGYCHVPLEDLPAQALIERFSDLPRALEGI